MRCCVLLIKCGKCGCSMYDTGQECPHCGNKRIATPVLKTKDKSNTILFILIGILISAVIITAMLVLSKYFNIIS
jgi:DNA-directed RNA polymerase subunit RPC12/RpoP